MTFEDVWRQARGLPDTTIQQVPGVLSVDTKKNLSRLMPEEVSKIVASAIEEVNHGTSLHWMSL